MIEPQPTPEAQHRNIFVLRALVVLGFAFLLLAVAPQAAHALDLGGAVDTVTDTVEPVTNTVGQVVDSVTDTLDPVTQTVTDPPVVVPVYPPAVPQQPGSPSEAPIGHGAGHHDGTTVVSTAGSADVEGLVVETGISPVPTSTSSTSRSSQPSAPTPSSGQPIPVLPPIVGAAAGQLVGGGSAGLNLVAVLAAAIALAFGWSRWFRLVQPLRVLAPFVSLADRPG